jgi:acyl-CoA dehydrogenase
VSGAVELWRAAGADRRSSARIARLAARGLSSSRRPGSGSSQATGAGIDKECTLAFEKTERIEEILEVVRKLMKKEVYPLERAFWHRPFDELRAEVDKLREKAKQMGLFAPHIPEELGGAGLKLTEFAHLSEELGRSPLGHYVFNCQAPDISNMELLLAHGTEEQKQRFLMPLIRGEIRSCFLMTEPEFAGSNPVWMATTARKEGDEWVIRGHKWFATSADGAAFGIAMVVTDPDNDNRYARASMIIVPTDTEGFELVQNISVMGHRGADYASHGEVQLHGCRVPLGNLLGGEGMGFLLAQDRLGPGRIHHCMRWIGICERAFDLMCQYAATRELAPGKPLGTRQIVQQWIADSRAEIHASRLMVLNAAEKVEKQGTYAAREEISLIKFWVANVLQRVLDRAIQVHGALGMTDDTPLAFWYAHERAARIYDGPDEVHKTVVARRILREYGIKIGSVS